MPNQAGQLSKRHMKRRQIMREELSTRLYVNEVISLLRTDWDPERVDEFRVKLDGWFKLIGKVLPDAKESQVTFGGSVGVNHAVGISVVNSALGELRAGIAAGGGEALGEDGPVLLDAVRVGEEGRGESVDILADQDGGAESG